MVGGAAAVGLVHPAAVRPPFSAESGSQPRDPMQRENEATFPGTMVDDHPTTLFLHTTSAFPITGIE